MQTNSALTKIKKSKKQEQYTKQPDKANKQKRNKNLFKRWGV